MSSMFLNIVSTFKGDGLGAATRQLGAFGKAAGGLGGTLGKVGAALASFGIATKAVQFTSDTIDSARDLERNLFSVNTIFGDLAPNMVKFTKDAEKIGLSQKDAAKASTFLGSVLKQSGFEMGFVGKETQKLVTLAQDLATTYGYDVQEALLGMTALFRGEYDPIEKFGVAMKQNEINSELAARGQDKLQGAARRNAEQTIRLELLYQRAADASGAFAKQSGNLYVEQKKLSAAWENMQATVGAALLPAMGRLVEALKPLVDVLTPRLIEVVNNAQPGLQTFIGFLEDLSDKTSTSAQTIGFLADSIGNLFDFISKNFGILVQLGIVLGIVRTAFMLFSAALATTLPGWIAIGIAALAASLLLVADAAKEAQINQRKLNDEWVKDPWKQAANPARVYEGIIGDINKQTKKATFSISEYIVSANRVEEIRFKGHIDQIKKIQNAWTNAWNARAQYEGGGGGFTMTTGQTDDTSTDFTGGGKKSLSGFKTFTNSLKKNLKIAKKESKLLGSGLSSGLVDSILGGKSPLKTANKVLKKIAATGGKYGKKIQKLFNKTKAGRAELTRIEQEATRRSEEAAAERARIAEEQARAEAEALAEKQRIYNSFLDSVKNTFGQIRDSIMGAFDITGLGGSTNSIIRNMNKLLEKTKGFASNISKLSSMGLDPKLLQQVIAAGPLAGARLANALVMGGTGALGQINAAYGEFGSLASQIASTGTTALFGTPTQQSIYNINVDGGVGSGATIGKAIVDAIKAYERTSGAVWVGA